MRTVPANNLFTIHIWQFCINFLYILFSETFEIRSIRQMGQKTTLLKPRWSNHKSHIRKGQKTCNLATHCIGHHEDTMVGGGKLFTTREVQNLLILTLLESVGKDGSFEALELCEEQWRNKLQSWAPTGLNIREDGPQHLRRKNILIS